MTNAHKGVVSRRGPQPTGSYPHAHVHGNMVWVTAQAGRDPSSGELVEGGMAGQMDRAISNLEAILEECGSSLDRVIRTQIMYTDRSDVEAILKAAGSSLEHVVKAQIEFVEEKDLDAMNRIYGERFHEPLPARTSFGAAFLWKGAKVQIDCVAAVE